MSGLANVRLRTIVARAALPCAALLALVGTAPNAAAQISSAEFAARRAALAAKLEDGVFVARGAIEPVQDYMSFFQSPGFLYLTGFREADATLLMTKHGSDVQWSLFVQKKIPSQEVWSGQRYGAEKARELTGINARTVDALEPALDSALASSKKLYVLADIAESGDTLNGDDRFVQRLREKHPGVQITGANLLVMQLRGTKSAAELELLRKAIAISMDAHREAMKAVEPGMNEFEIQALVEYTFRRNGAERPAYSSIVGSGANSTTLHYNKDDKFVQAGEVIVMDVAAQYGGYAADITRSFPVSGTFSADQKELYQVVRDAQSAAERNAKPGTRASVMNDSAKSVIANGLAKLGLIEAPDAMYDCGTTQQPRECPQYSLYYMHGLGHGIGLEVHDPDQFYFTGIIGPGSAFTIEPGIYVRGNLLDIIPKTTRNARLVSKIAASVKKFADVGVRIEDDYLVTDQGLEWVSCGLPREASEVEALMQGTYSGPPARDAQKVDWYKARDGGTAQSAKYQRPASCVKM